MITRTMWGITAAVIALFIIWAGGVWYALTIGLMTVLAVLEYAGLMRKQNLRPYTGVMLGSALFLLGLIYFTVGRPGLNINQSAYARNSEAFFLPLLVGFFLITMFFELGRGEPDHGLINAGANLFGMVYIGFMFAYILLLRFIPGGEGKDGLFFLISALGVTWLNDSCAYFVGVTIGKHKLCPRISPQKSVEGAVGGLIGGLTAALCLALIFNKPVLLMLILGLVATAAGQAGDLVESIIKRNAGVKDSGAFLPGHGGVLDRLDSLLLTAPVVYYIAVYIAPLFA
ncbi:MAG: phosphatidate cytidylyltransferase [Firmicutes bacterium]|nr:phosphatidate cytidylyltransferase [Bacillota bacterium]